ncbi:TetR/AcrR family transcriptional regulator [Geodermatophilus sabuli]|uniref:Transcriptional regulator, TetR family n=1 Tax=Geodermatophilus sabuli TaxID=1564158 RepID=A0A285EIL0_9ACTN|nr:TetR/AcrR family transcriptional regulator [Geodermatophilus sabuli]MBB3086776.1 AcrR family transcriptional regulator [Geodermatophilus sabuli]SNX98850.1 transcriptional regulator, TetR family [Geodermatophilus sabuli]
MPPRNPGRLRADLVAAAAELIERTGSVEAVTLRAVAREAGVTAPAVYGHFTDLGALVEAVLEEGFLALRASIDAAVAGIDDPVERLVAGCRAYVTAGLAAPARYRAMFRQGEVPGGRVAFDVLTDAVAACQEAGRSASRDARGDAVLVWTALHGVVTLRAAGVAAVDLDGRLRALVGRLALVRTEVSGGDGAG